MASATNDRKFRRVDVDRFDENTFVEDADDNQSQGELLTSSDVTGFLSRNQNADALRLVLQKGPLSKAPQEKQQARQLVVQVLTSFKTGEIAAAVKSLSEHEVHSLMKYIYKGFEISDGQACALLHSWHEKTFAVCGLGGVVRVLTDRITV